MVRNAFDTLYHFLVEPFRSRSTYVPIPRLQKTCGFFLYVLMCAGLTAPLMDQWIHSLR